MVCNETMDPMKIRGVLVMVHGVGVLIRGPSGVGKSLAALNLMRRGHSLISDDLVEVTLNPAGDIVGRSVEEEVRIEVTRPGDLCSPNSVPPCSGPIIAHRFCSRFGYL